MVPPDPSAGGPLIVDRFRDSQPVEPDRDDASREPCAVPGDNRHRLPHGDASGLVAERSRGDAGDGGDGGVVRVQLVSGVVDWDLAVAGLAISTLFRK